MSDRQTILRHIETSVDVDEWAVVGVKENFDKLEKIEQIVNSWDGSIELCENDWKYISKIKKVLEKE